jgi:hypothetical protein
MIYEVLIPVLDTQPIITKKKRQGRLKEEAWKQRGEYVYALASPPNALVQIPLS